MIIPNIWRGSLSSTSIDIKKKLLTSIEDCVFTRNSVATVTDHEGIIKKSKANEARFEGLRRVENLIRSNPMTWGGGSHTKTAGRPDPDGGTKAVTFTVTSASTFVQDLRNDEDYYSGGVRKYTNQCWVRRRTGTGQIRMDGRGQVKDITTQIADGEWHEISTQQAKTSTTGGILYHAFWFANSGDEIDVYQPMTEEVTNQADVNPSEFVSNGEDTGIYGGDQAVNGDFTNWTGSNPDNWNVTEGVGMSVEEDDGKARFVGINTGLVISQQILEIGKLYKVELTCTAHTGGGDLLFSNTANTASGSGVLEITTTGKYTGIFTATTEHIYIARVSASGPIMDVTVDNVIVKEAHHGAGVDGVKYFDHENGNTVDGNFEITRAKGTDLTTLKGFVQEKTATNLQIYSQDYNNVVWTKDNLNINPTATTAPDGTLTGNSLENTATAGSRRIYDLSTVTTGLDYVMSAYVKAGTAAGLLMMESGLGGSNYDLTTGTVTTGNGNIEAVGDGWYRVWESHVANDTTWVTQIWNTSQSLNKTIFVWGVQVERGKFPTSYIKTEASTVTRIDDNLQYELGVDNFPQEFTYIIDFIPFDDGINYDNQELRVFGTDDSRGGNNEIRSNLSTVYGLTVIGASGLNISIDKADIQENIRTKVAITLKKEGSNARVIVVKDGLAKFNNVSAFVFDHSNLGILSIARFETNPSIINVKGFELYKKALSINQLIALTTI